MYAAINTTDSPIQRMRAALRDFHDSERADIPVGTVLLIALIVLPLMFLLIAYRKRIVEYFQEQFGEMLDSGEEANQPDAGE